jgi:hypothetical protein
MTWFLHKWDIIGLLVGEVAVRLPAGLLSKQRMDPGKLKVR